jgi:hypothetical protein
MIDTDKIEGMPEHWAISDALHEQLLEECIVEYDYIWRELADK